MTLLSSEILCCLWGPVFPTPSGWFGRLGWLPIPFAIPFVSECLATFGSSWTVGLATGLLAGGAEFWGTGIDRAVLGALCWVVGFWLWAGDVFGLPFGSFAIPFKRPAPAHLVLLFTVFLLCVHSKSCRKTCQKTVGRHCKYWPANYSSGCSIWFSVWTICLSNFCVAQCSALDFLVDFAKKIVLGNMYANSSTDAGWTV